ncbi:MAG: hypothetical protein ACREQO_03000, partial [Candidatus Binatia bacterium]
PEFFEKVLARRYGPARKDEPKPYDRRKYRTWKGSIALEDIVTQSTQAKLGERREQLGYADRGVILLRKLVREAIETTQRGGRPKGVFSAADADKIIEFGCFTGVRKQSTDDSYLDAVGDRASFGEVAKD